MDLRRYALIALLAMTLAGCSGVATHGVSPGWVETRLYFGLGPADRPGEGMDDAGWRRFLDSDVTPRFPDGLSVVDAYGQWQSPKGGAPERLRSKILVIDYPDQPANRAKIEAIRDSWKRTTGDESVMRVTQPAEVSF